MVDRVDINSVLMQMRQVKSQLRAQHQQNTQAPQTMKPQELQALRAAKLESQVKALDSVESVDSIRGDQGVPSFQAMFKNAINGVNNQQQAASNLATRFEQGDPTVDLPEVMIALQKSTVSFQAMTQVRNKLVDAYKEIMNMPV